MAKTDTVENEILTALKIRQNEGEPRNKFLARVTRLLAAPEKKYQDIWEGLSETSQLWANDAVDALEAGKPIQEFTKLDGSDASGAKEEDVAKKAPEPDDDEDEKPKAKKAKASDDDDDEPAPPKKKAKPADDDDDDEPAPKKKKAADEDDDDDKSAKPKKKAKSSDDDDDDAKPAKKAKKKDDDDGGGRSGPDGIKYKIKAYLIENPDADVDAVVGAMKKAKVDTSDGTVRSVRSEFRHTMRVLRDHNVLRK